MIVGLSEPAIFSDFSRHIFGTFRAEGLEGDVIIQRNEVLYRLFSDLKMLDLE